VIGLYTIGAYWFTTTSTSFANPAVTLAITSKPSYPEHFDHSAATDYFLTFTCTPRIDYLMMSRRPIPQHSNRFACDESF
jgi:hypothetical protein